jgi:DHA1 family bicyclomycin/chloramphenicol resistance-like MFS transporter
MNILERIRQEQQIFYLALATALRGTRDNIRIVIWQPFALSLGIPIKDIGALESLMDLAKIVIQPILGAASDRWGRKPFMVLRDLLVVFAGIFFLFAKSWLYLALGMVLIGFSLALIPIWHSVVAESSQPDQIGWVFSILGSVYMAMGLLGTLSSGWLADTFGYRIVYSIFVITSVLSLIVTFFKLEETHHSEENGSFGIGLIFNSILDTFRPPKYLWGYYIAMSVDLFAFSVGWRIINGILSEVSGFTPSMLGIVFAFQTGTMALGQFILGKRVDLHGYRKFLTLSQIISSIILASLIISPTFSVAIVANILMGVGAALWMPAEQAWIAINVDPTERAKSIGGYSTFRGLVALPGPYIGGLLYDKFGYKAPLFVNLVLAIIDIFLLWYLISDNAREEAEKFVSV